MSVKDKALASSTSEDCHALTPDSDKDNTWTIVVETDQECKCVIVVLDLDSMSCVYSYNNLLMILSSL